jgi:thiaminase
MSFYQKLQAETETERQALISVPIIQRALKGNISLDEYQRFLTQAFHHVKHTTPLLMTVGGKLAQDMEWLREAVAEYIEEELGHQEWILNDIAACGADKEIARNSEPNFSTELMVAYAYDCVNRVHPVCFFGMVLVLEGTSVALADIAANEIAKTLKLPKSAFTYLHSHGALDQEHVVFFQQLMDQITDPEQQQMIIHSAKRFYKLYANVFRELDSTISTQIAA